MLAKHMPSTGRAISVAACSILSLGVLAEVFAIFGQWWTDEHIHNQGPLTLVAEIKVTLWKVHVMSKYGRFEDLSLSWAEYCGPNYANDQSWCHKIRAVRATNILAVCFGVFALVAFLMATFKNSRWGGRAIACTLLSMICAVCACSVSSFYAAASRPAVDEPGAAFICMCFGALASLVTIILSMYSMQYTSGLRSMDSGIFVELAKGPKNEVEPQQSGKMMRARHGKAAVAFAGFLMFIGGAMETIAIFGPWWMDTHIVTDTNGDATDVKVGEIDVTLWSVHVHSRYGKFKDITLSWQEYCGPQYANNESWCHKVRDVRATTITAASLGFLCLIPLTLAVALEKRGCAACAVLGIFLSMCCAVSAFSVSLFFPNSTRPAVDSPGISFVLVCIDALFRLIASLLACYGFWFNSNVEVKDLREEELKVAVAKSLSPPVTPYGSEATTCAGSSPPATPYGSSYECEEAGEFDPELGYMYPVQSSAQGAP